MKIFTKTWLKYELIGILVIGIAVLGGNYMDSYYEDKEEVETFINEYYNQAVLTSSSASYVLSNTDNPEQLKKGLDELTKRINKLDSLLYTGRQYVDSNITTKDFARLTELQKIEDSTPTDAQLSNIENLKKSMEYIADELRSDDPTRDNKTVTVETFNDIMSDSTDFLF
ncbi:hypothetical protein [Pontibacillus salipaludis]|uniref:Uncharacterized protein n=1 Tax=Pontibacillus salipaludis TaxID=1697394 RepID=A0ABQ1Q0S1_9BACI|nr:hypothetical protein [Pontibacillus salipaludis]GGD08456.1 hypothetical protein GCM10011389_15060 [Pontibacillus salipaludis]